MENYISETNLFADKGVWFQRSVILQLYLFKNSKILFSFTKYILYLYAKKHAEDIAGLFSENYKNVF